MPYERYLESIRGEHFRLDDESSHAKVLFWIFCTPEIRGDASARILEVGCGSEKVLCAAHECGFANIEGGEISDEQITFGRFARGLPLEKCDALEKNDRAAW